MRQVVWSSLGLRLTTDSTVTAGRNLAGRAVPIADLAVAQAIWRLEVQPNTSSVLRCLPRGLLDGVEKFPCIQVVVWIGPAECRY